MKPRSSFVLSLIAASLLVTSAMAAVPLTVTVKPSPPPRTDGFHLGTATAPDGSSLTVDSRSFILNGQRWTPAMGEFHFSRYPADEWAEELGKMKAGGIDIVATYVFWIHHEELENQWNWADQKNLHRFVQTADAAGLKVIVRLGPWCHGEVRNGGIPDWVLDQKWSVRSDDTHYLAKVERLYGQIASQLKGLLWKDGGPIIGVQLENEYRGPAEHLLTLKRLAIAAGLDVPVYTRTGWPDLTSPLPFGEILPLYGVYAEGFWDRELTSMPGRYWSGFHFSKLRVDANIANEALGRRDAQDPADIADYPYLTCEIGGGMMSSYHRRIRMMPDDVTSTTLVKLGSGSVSPGYYMYHGGTNPDGAISTLMEEQATRITNWNDMPVKNYDFQAPLGQYGQVRPHYAGLRQLHQLLDVCGPELAAMDTFLPDQRPTGKADHATLRWSVRSDGHAGFVFFNNHERGATMPAHPAVQFLVNLPSGPLVFPQNPVAIEPHEHAIWPFNLDLGHGLTLAWATAQPTDRSTAADGSIVWEFTRVAVQSGPVEFAVRGLTPDADKPQVFQLNAAVSASAESFDLTAPDGQSLRLILKSAPPSSAPEVLATATFKLLHPAGPAREIPIATKTQGVATAPSEADFAAAAEWLITLPTDFDPTTSDALLRFHYVGDVAQLYLGDTFITDDYYNGAALEIGLRRHAAAIAAGAPIRLLVLPLRRNAVLGDSPKIFLSDPAAMPVFGDREAVAELNAVDLVSRL